MGVRLSPQHLLSLAARLQGATDMHALVNVTAEEIEQRIGYKSTWLYVIEDESKARLVATHGDGAAPAWEHTPVLDLKGDPFLQQCINGDEVVVVEDARTDPRTDKELVARAGCVSIVVVPLRLVDETLGALSMGTFGDEPTKVPTPEERDYLVQMASQLAVAAGRVRMAQERQAHAVEKRQLQERLESAQRLQSLGLLAGGAAHDLNNMLTVIVSSLSLLEPDALTEMQCGALADTHAATEAAIDLAAELLSLSREREPRMLRVSVADQLWGVARLVQRVLPPGIELRQEPVASGLWISADSAQLNQVLMNLCVNARDAMPDGGVLTLGARAGAPGPKAAGGERVFITVEDTGAGIPPEVQARMWEPLFSTKQEHGGTGLGLSVAKRIVDGHGGELDCRSEPGLGTVFTLSFDRVPSADGAERRTTGQVIATDHGHSRRTCAEH